MGLFTTTIASGITDRVAAIQKGLESTLIQARNAAPPGGIYQRVTASNDYQTENSFITPGYNFELSLSGTVLFGGSQATIALMNSLSAHTNATAQVTFDTFLNNSGLQVSEHFARIYGAGTGSQLTAHNVFAEEDIVLATATKVGAGNWTFAQGTNLGSGGTSKFSTNPFNTGEQIIVAALPSGVTTSSCTMSVSGLDDAGHVQQASFSFPNGVANAAALVSPILAYRTITNIAVSTDTGITNASVVTFVNKRSRIVTY